MTDGQLFISWLMNAELLSLRVPSSSRTHLLHTSSATISLTVAISTAARSRCLMTTRQITLIRKSFGNDKGDSVFNHKRLSLARKRRRLTGKGLAELAGISAITVSRL